MEQTVARPKNKDVGKPSRTKYIKVMLTSDEKAEIEAFAEREITQPAVLMRSLVLKAARDD